MAIGDFGVTMMGYSYMDLISGTVGAYFYQVVWLALHSCGLTIFPFLIVIVSALRQNYESDNLNDEPHQQLSRLAVKLVVMSVVMVIAGAPTIKVKELAVRMQLRTCDSLGIDLERESRSIVTPIMKTVPILGQFLTARTTFKEQIRKKEVAAYKNEKESLGRITAQLTVGGNYIRVPIWWFFWRQMMLVLEALLPLIYHVMKV